MTIESRPIDAKTLSDIDREKWKPCANCRYEDKEMSIYYPHNYNGGLGIRYGLAHYCPKCGRPLTDQAWAELEKRLRG